MGERLYVRRRIGDVETPVGALLKLGPDLPGTFLFESIVGGERLGRYSFIGHDPVEWFRVRDGVPETSPDVSFASPTALEASPVVALRTYAEAAR